jgi:hypothetical protein
MFPRKLPGVSNPMSMKPSPPPDNRVAANVPMPINRSIMPMRGLRLLSGVKRPIKYM